MKKEADLSEARDSRKIRKAYKETEWRIFSLISMLNDKLKGSKGAANNNDLNISMERTHEELEMEQKRTISSNEGHKDSTPTEPELKRQKLEDIEETEREEEDIAERVTRSVERFEEHLDRAHEGMVAVMN